MTAVTFGSRARAGDEKRARLLEEARYFVLRHACEDCVHFASDGGSCSHGYPNAMHRRAAVETQGDIEFCKEFELA